jgi:hypothetical protein
VRFSQQGLGHLQAMALPVAKRSGAKQVLEALFQAVFAEPDLLGDRPQTRPIAQVASQ